MLTLQRRVLPGFRLSLGFTIVYLTFIVLVPLSACLITAASLSPGQFIDAVWTERTRAAYALSLGASLTAGTLNVVLGLLLAWVLARYQFPFKRLIDALVDLPFALPTAVAGLVYSSLYAPSGWLGQYLSPLGIDGAYSRLGVVLVLTFTGLPFVVRTVQPVLLDLDDDVEEAASVLGATRLQTFFRVILPALTPHPSQNDARLYAPDRWGQRWFHSIGRLNSSTGAAFKPFCAAEPRLCLSFFETSVL